MYGDRAKTAELSTGPYSTHSGQGRAMILSDWRGPKYGGVDTSDRAEQPDF